MLVETKYGRYVLPTDALVGINDTDAHSEQGASLRSVMTRLKRAVTRHRPSRRFVFLTR